MAWKIAGEACFLGDSRFRDGITNGAQWYYLAGKEFPTNNTQIFEFKYLSSVSDNVVVHFMKQCSNDYDTIENMFSDYAKIQENTLTSNAVRKPRLLLSTEIVNRLKIKVWLPSTQS